jgi:hypothetical protein
MTTLDQYNKKQARQARKAEQGIKESMARIAQENADKAALAAINAPKVGDTMERKLYPWTPKQGMQVTFPFWNSHEGCMDDVHGFVIHVYHNLDFILSSDPKEPRNPARYAYCTVPGIF